MKWRGTVEKVGVGEVLAALILAGLILAFLWACIMACGGGASLAVQVFR